MEPANVSVPSQPSRPLEALERILARLTPSTTTPMQTPKTIIIENPKGIREGTKRGTSDNSPVITARASEIPMTYSSRLRVWSGAKRVPAQLPHNAAKSAPLPRARGHTV